jgi:hypothetical protein
VTALSVACSWKQKTVDANVVAGWQPCVDPEPAEEDEWSDTDTDQLTGTF